MKAKVLLNYNFKGGVGKTTTTGMESYIMATRLKKKVLLIDCDPQESLSEMVTTTFKFNGEPKKDLFNCLMDGDLSQGILNIANNVDLIKSTWKMNDWPKYIANLSETRRYNILSNLIEPLKDKYDYIFIDTPPTLNDIVKNAIFAADGISIVMQTQKMSYNSAIMTIKELYKLKNEFNLHFDLLGVVLYLYLKAKVDREVATEARKNFGKAIYDTPVKYQERVKGFTSYGIQDKDFWDIKAIGMYRKLTEEMIKRMDE